MSNMLVVFVLITHLVLGGMIGYYVCIRRTTKKITIIEKELKDSKKYAEHFFEKNEMLRVYLDNRHMVWDGRDDEIFVKKPMERGMVLVAKLDDLQAMYQRTWNTSKVMADRFSAQEFERLSNQQLAVQTSENVVTMRASIGNKRFDHDFARLVNQITDTAIQYGHTQQLRTRMSYLVTDFRSYMSSRQDGKSGVFPS